MLGLFAQTPPIGPGYDEWKAQVAASMPHIPPAITVDEGNSNGTTRGGSGTCDCWHTPDASYTLINNNTQWNAGGGNNGDDGSYGPINIPFQFYLYGQYWNTFYININGNVSFGNFYGTFSSTGFPVSGYTMVAPFWADVDLRGTCANCNKVQYKVTPTAVYVNWTRVGYFSQQVDKLNTFQLIFSDGNDPVIPNGANVSFCYQDMQWTTGSASGGTNGFGGTPASVGANQGNGVDYLQFGRFDHAGTDYDGPFNNADGVSFLDYQNFTFSTDVTTANVPPVVAGESVCDSLVLCVGQPGQLDFVFLSPEPGQITTPSASAPGLSNFNIIASSPGQTANITAVVTPTMADTGYHTISFSGTDDGNPVMTSTVTISVHVLPSPILPMGTLSACAGGESVPLHNALGGAAPAGGEWSDPLGSPHTDQFDPASDPQGIYTYAVDTTGGCPLIGQVTVTTYLMENDSLVTDALCHGDGTGEIQVVSSGNGGPWNYTWTNADHVVVQTTQNAVGDVFQGSGGLYHVLITEGANGNGCADSLEAFIHEPAAVELLSVSPDTTICYTGTATLIATAQGGTGSLTGHWNDGVVGWARSVTPADTATYSVWATDANGCLSDTISVNVNVLAPITFQLADTTIACPHVDVPLHADSLAGGNGDYFFDWGHGTGPEPTDTLNTELSQQYCVTITDGCETPAVPHCGWLSVTPIPELVLTADTTLGCDPFTVRFSVLDTTGGATVDWSFGDGLTHPGPPAVVGHSYTNPGVYDVHVLVHWPNGCDDDSTYQNMITVATVPIADFVWTKDPTDIFEPLIHFDETSGTYATGWIWDFAGLDTAHGPSVEHLFPNDVGRSYPVQLVVSNYLGCTDTVMHEVEVQDVFLVYVPTGFTPDGDGLNEEFRVSGNDIAPDDFSLMVFDRWGEKIFESNDRAIGWDGKLGGSPVPSGVYAWKLHARSAYFGTAKEMMGQVSLMH